MFSCVVAMDANRGIGKNGDLPWPALKADLKHFSQLTTQAPADHINVVIMGRKTWDSLPPAYQPLPRRHNIVISRQALALPIGAQAATSFEQALELAETHPARGDIFVVGGGQIYATAVNHPRCQYIYLTTVAENFDCDTHLVPLDHFTPDPTWHVQHHSAGDIEYTIERLQRRKAS